MVIGDSKYITVYTLLCVVCRQRLTVHSDCCVLATCLDVVGRHGNG